jgi:hypothetical protein
MSGKRKSIHPKVLWRVGGVINAHDEYVKYVYMSNAGGTTTGVYKLDQSTTGRANAYNLATSKTMIDQKPTTIPKALRSILKTKVMQKPFDLATDDERSLGWGAVDETTASATAPEPVRAPAPVRAEHAEPAHLIIPVRAEPAEPEHLIIPVRAESAEPAPVRAPAPRRGPIQIRNAEPLRRITATV